jgi:hypothetical protein
MIQKIIFFCVFLVSVLQSFCALSLAEQFRQAGYTEFCDTAHGTVAYDSLYACFEELIEFVQANPAWINKLYCAKERFIRSKDQHYYSTNFFGFYDELQTQGCSQISFYYSVHFHEFICSVYPEFTQVVPLMRFFEICFEIQNSYAALFEHAAAQLDLQMIFSSQYGHVPILFKVVKYFPGYRASRPHYDGTAFSIFLDSTDNTSLLLAEYKPLLTVDDFFTPVRKFSRESHQNSILLIPGSLLTEFCIWPTPHIVISQDKTRYATIAFAMRPDFLQQKNELAVLPSFKN